MRLYDEIFKNTEGFPLARCTFIPEGGGYFEGVKAVGDFSSERVVLCFPRCSVSVEGVGLCIKKYCDGDLQLTGKILTLTTEQNPTDKGDAQ